MASSKRQASRTPLELIDRIAAVVGQPLRYQGQKRPVPLDSSGHAIANGRDEGVTKLPAPKPTTVSLRERKILGESIGMAVEVAHGSCTDVPPAKK
jgi:hypothetical protein